MFSLTLFRDIVAAKAKYQPLCNTEYTRPKMQKQMQSREVREYKPHELETFHIIIKLCHEMITNQSKIYDLTIFMKNHLHKRGMQITVSTENLRRTLKLRSRMRLSSNMYREMSYCIPHKWKLKL